MKNSFEKFKVENINEDKVNKVEIQAFVNKEALPESQLNQINIIDNKIKDVKQQILNMDYTGEFGSDYINSKKSLKLEDELLDLDDQKKSIIKSN